MALDQSLILNLPDAPDFISEAHYYTASEIIQMCEPFLPYWNSIRYSKPEPEFLGEAFRLYVDGDVQDVSKPSC